MRTPVARVRGARPLARCQTGRVTLLEPTPVHVRVRTALDRVREAAPLSTADVAALLQADGDCFEELLAQASAVRDAGLAAAGRPGAITYSRKVFVPLTTLCRDRCHYCVFVDTPAQLRAKGKPPFMSAEQVLAVAHQGRALGCEEALLTLGDRPEDRWPEARAWLDAHGYASTLDYVGAMARLVTAETGLLAHLNPGVMSAAELTALRPTAPSMGMMLETTSRRLFAERGQVHFGSPDKDPAVRLRVIEDAGRARIPFTTGILVGIGETVGDRAESLIALRDAHERHGHLQEVIVQNFRAKDHTAMRSVPDAAAREHVAAVAVARLVMGPAMRIQVPPNLSDPDAFALLVRAGADDWGGVSPLTADHVNPERPWPQLDELAARTAALGFRLRERLTAHPEFVLAADTWIDPSLHAAVAALADPSTGLAAAPADPVTGLAAAPAGASAGRLAGGRAAAPDGLVAAPFAVRDAGDAAQPDPVAPRQGADILRAAPPSAAPAPGAGALAELLHRAAADPAELDDAEWVRLLHATGDDLDLLAATADDVRRYTVGEAITLVVNRNLTSSGLRTARPDPGAVPLARSGSEPAASAGTGSFTLAEVAAIAADAAALGATELCVQGLLPASEDPQGYLDLVRTAHTAAPELHLHAYRPQDVWDLADRGGLGLDGALEALRAAGVGTVPGTGVKVLSERVRRLVAPADLETDRWLEAIGTAHRAGLRSTSVLFYGHVETAAERIAHLRRLRSLQDATGGFTEFVPIPLPGAAGGVPLVPGRTAIDEHRAMVAVARLFLSGSVGHIQVPWPRVGLPAAAVLLRSGGDDLGGTLLDGRVRPDAAVEQGQELPATDAAALATRMFRPFRLRTTDYRHAEAGGR